jgi:hypothetical protein
VLSPLAERRVQATPELIVAALTVMVSVAMAVPELVSSAVPDTPALPHVVPNSVNAMLDVVPVKLGSTRVIWSFTAMVAGVVKEYDRVVAVLPVVVAKTRASELIAVHVMVGEVLIGMVNVGECELPIPCSLPLPCQRTLLDEELRGRGGVASM